VNYWLGHFGSTSSHTSLPIEISNLARINIKEYNSDFNSNIMFNDNNNEEISNEGSFKSKKGVHVTPSNESREEVNDREAVQDIQRPGVPDEAKFRELKHKANETIKTNGQESNQEKNVAQEDN
jgi:hypothetical protein